MHNASNTMYTFILHFHQKQKKLQIFLQACLLSLTLLGPNRLWYKVLNLFLV